MAARTSMLDLELGDWSPELLRLFRVPRAILPTVADTVGRRAVLDAHWRVTATMGDQGPGALAALEPGRASALVNLGTGAFVLRPAAGPDVRRPGYLTAPILAAPNGDERYVLEGGINGAGAALDGFRSGVSFTLPDHDPAPGAFCIPDVAGLGSPHWRPTLGLCFSESAERLDRDAQGRIVLEGILFRVRQILDDMFDAERPERIILSGGLTRETALVRGLASLLGRPVEVLREQEGILLGAARLAAGEDPYDNPTTDTTEPSNHGTYLAEKYQDWKPWLTSLL